MKLKNDILNNMKNEDNHKNYFFCSNNDEYEDFSIEKKEHQIISDNNIFINDDWFYQNKKNLKKMKILMITFRINIIMRCAMK